MSFQMYSLEFIDALKVWYKGSDKYLRLLLSALKMLLNA